MAYATVDDVNKKIKEQFGSQIDAFTANPNHDWNSLDGRVLHQRVENLRKTMGGYSGGADGTQVNPIKTAATAATQPETPVVTAQPVVQQTPNYMSMFPSLSRDQFISQARAAGQTGANLKYDSMQDDLKKRVAQIMNQISTRRGKVEGEYQPMYQQNEQDRYSQQSADKSVLARRGLLTSGVDLGTQAATNMRYDGARQGIDLQKQNVYNDLTGQELEANTNLEMDLNSLAKEKANYLADVEAQAAKDYIEYAKGERDFMADDYWRNKNYGLESQKLQQSSDQFQQDLDYKYKGLEQNQSQFESSQTQNQNQFDAKMKQDADQWADQIGLDRKKFDESVRQFDENLGWDKEKTGKQLAAEYARIDADLTKSRWDVNIAIAKMDEEARQFDKSFELQLGNMSMDAKKQLTDENDRIDTTIMGIMQAQKAGQIDETTAKKMITSTIRTSWLPGSAQAEKLKLISEVAAGATTGKTTGGTVAKTPTPYLGWQNALGNMLVGAGSNWMKNSGFSDPTPDSLLGKYQAGDYDVSKLSSADQQKLMMLFQQFFK